jgi:hypothetical protein
MDNLHERITIVENLVRNDIDTLHEERKTSSMVQFYKSI